MNDDGSPSRTRVSARSPLADTFGDIDIYVFDLLLKDRIRPGMRILDAGCGAGRNLIYMMRSGFEVWGVDESPGAIERLRSVARELAPRLGDERFTVQRVESLTFADASFDVVLSSAVLHFARDEAQWWSMLREMWRVLAPGGFLFARLASTLGHEAHLKPIGGRRYAMPDGHERLLIDDAMLMAATAELGGALLDPLRTTVVHGARSMATWVVGKGEG